MSSYIPSLIKNQLSYYLRNFPLDRNFFSFSEEYDIDNIQYLTDLSFVKHRFFQLTPTSKQQNNEIYKFASDLILSLYNCRLYTNLNNNDCRVQRCFMSLRCFMTYLNIYESDDIELYKYSKDYLNYLILRPFSNIDLIPVFFLLVQSVCQKFDKMFSEADLSRLPPNSKVQLYQIHKQKLALLLVAFSCFYYTADKDFILTYIFDVKEFLDQEFSINIEKPDECPICLEIGNINRLDNCCHWICEDCKTKCFECPYCKVPIYSLPAQRHVTITRNVFVIPEEHQNFFMFGK
jgi:hypothetical protein